LKEKDLSMTSTKPVIYTCHIHVLRQKMKKRKNEGKSGELDIHKTCHIHVLRQKDEKEKKRREIKNQG